MGTKSKKRGRKEDHPPERHPLPPRLKLIKSFCLLQENKGLMMAARCTAMEVTKNRGRKFSANCRKFSRKDGEAI